MLPQLRPFVEPGGSAEKRSGEESGKLRYPMRGGSSGRRVQLKVEELP